MTTRSRRRPARRNEFGTTIVEAALIAPLFFAMLFGVVETGAFFFNRSAIGDAAAQGARTGAIAGNDADADLQILKTAKTFLPDGATTLRYIIVFKAANGLDRTPSSTCIASAEAGGTGVATVCNVYQRSVVLNPVASTFGYDQTTAPTKTSDMNWPALQRSASFSGGRDLVGVYISARYKGVSGVLPPHTWNLSALHQLEGESV